MPNEIDAAAAFIDQFTSDDVEHYGKKGMKWGVRNDSGHEGFRATSKKIAKLDEKFEKKAQSSATTFKIHNAAADKFNKNDLNTINSKTEYKNVNLYSDSKTARKYNKEVQDAFVKRLQEAANDLGTNASGTRRYSVVDYGDRWDVITDVVKHGEDDSITYVVSRNDLGHVVDIGLDESNDSMKHYGVKGQKWGVTRQGSASASLSPGGGSASVSLSNPRAEKRAQYKADLKSGRANAKLGKTLTDAEVKAMSTNAKRKIVAGLAIYGGTQLASYALSQGANRVLASQAAAGSQRVNESLKQIGDLGTYVLRPNGAGVWG